MMQHNKTSYNRSAKTQPKKGHVLFILTVSAVLSQTWFIIITLAFKEALLSVFTRAHTRSDDLFSFTQPSGTLQAEGMFLGNHKLKHPGQHSLQFFFYAHTRNGNRNWHLNAPF